MSEVSMYMTPPPRAASLPDSRVAAVLTDESRHVLKTAVHNELIKRME